jgi:hypothetical protein
MRASRVSNAALKEVVFVDDSGIHGRGLFANRRIARGEYIGTFSGPPARRNGTHVLWVYGADGESVEGRRGNNLLRYVNHGLPCNAAFEGFDLYAVRAIAAGQEITIDYGWAE